MKNSRIAREHKTVSAMICLYCRNNHAKSGRVLCSQCQALLSFSRERLAKCRYGEKKPSCRKCSTHCYNAEFRRQIMAVMRYAGPRMVWRYPVLTLQHLLDSFIN